MPAIRRASLSDARDLARLLTELGHPTTESDLEQRWPAWTAAGNEALVAPTADRLLGLVTLHVTHVLHRPTPVGRITALIVDATARGQGIGRQLVAEAERNLSARGCALIEVTSHERLVDAHAFYGHLGYDRASLRFAKSL